MFVKKFIPETISGRLRKGGKMGLQEMMKWKEKLAVC